MQATLLILPLLIPLVTAMTALLLWNHRRSQRILSVVGAAANMVTTLALLIFTIGRLNHNQPPLIPEGAKEMIGSYSDPLPQALILTAIVIGFGVQAFALVLLKRVCQTLGTDDLREIHEADFHV